MRPPAISTTESRPAKASGCAGMSNEAASSMPRIVKVLPEPVWPYMKTVEQPPCLTCSISGPTPRSHTAPVASASLKASMALPPKSWCARNMRRRSACITAWCTTTRPAVGTLTQSNSPLASSWAKSGRLRASTRTRRTAATRGGAGGAASGARVSSGARRGASACRSRQATMAAAKASRCTRRDCRLSIIWRVAGSCRSASLSRASLSRASLAVAVEP